MQRLFSSSAHSRRLLTCAAAAFFASSIGLQTARADEDEEPSVSMPLVATQPTVVKVLSGVEKSVWASELTAPHGLTRDFAGNVYAVESTAGRVAKISPAGKIVARYGGDLKGPAWIVRDGERFFVTERKANRVLVMSPSGQFQAVGQEIIEPLGLAATPQGRIVVVAHTTSRVYDAMAPKATPNADKSALWRNFYSVESGKRYGLRCVVIDSDGSVLATDETDGKIMLISPAGRAATLISGLNDPTGITLSPRGEVFVAEEGAGRISRVETDGSLTVIADGLGQPRGLIFLDPRTLLVADRQGGQIWRVTLPRM